MSDQPVVDAAVRVFSDPAGLTEITNTLTRDPANGGGASAHDLGIVKIDLSGAEPDTLYYVQTQTYGAGGLVVYPDPAPLLEVKTAAGTAVATTDGSPIVNDLLSHRVADPRGTGPLPGALVLLKVPTISAYPLTAFVGDAVDLPAAVIDLNNLFHDRASGGDGYSARVGPGTVIEISEYRGLGCDQPDAQKATHLRRLPPAATTPGIAGVQAPAACFAPAGVAADFDCDGRVDPIDFNEFLIRLGTSRTDDACRFQSDFDLDGDSRVDTADFSRVLTVFGAAE